MASSRSTPDPAPSVRSYWHALRIAVGLGLVATSIHCLGVRRAVALVWKLAVRFPSDVPPPPDPPRMARALSQRISAVAARMPVQPRCLTCSLLLAGALRRRGVAGELCVGVASAGGFSAHAWVELDGVALNDTADVASRFHPIWRVAALSPGVELR